MNRIKQLDDELRNEDVAVCAAQQSDTSPSTKAVPVVTVESFLTILASNFRANRLADLDQAQGKEGR